MSRWTIIVPVKGGPSAKSRLDLGPGTDADRQSLALAFAQDMLGAVLEAPAVAHVCVVTGPDWSADTALVPRDPRAHTLAQHSPGLLGAIADGLAHARSVSAGPCAIMLSDLPALTGATVMTALARLDALLTSGHGQFFVPDAAGTGTVLLAACHISHLTPAFGPGSARAHERSATRLDWDLPRLRTDVDTAADVERACAVGVGPHTARLLASVRDGRSQPREPGACP